MWNLTGRIKGITHNSILLEVDSVPELPMDEDLSITLKKPATKRSLNANNYFHKLCDELRQKLGISMSACKNMLIASYGQIEYIEDIPMIYKTNAPPEYVRELEEVHMKLIKVDSEGAYWYRVYRGTHEYNTSEMAKLIDGTIQECKEQGIQTLTPNELARLEGYERSN